MTKIAATAKFNAVDEFVGELLAEKGNVVDGIVRVTKRFRSNPRLPVIRRVSINASAVVRTDVTVAPGDDRPIAFFLVELETQTLGEIGWNDEMDKATIERADEILGELEKRLDFFEIRSGAFER